MRRMVVNMPKGGARARSGPAADPGSYTSLRNGREWVLLPAEGYAGMVPGWPFEPSDAAEMAMWDDLWVKPQAAEWARLGLAYQVAAYVRAYVESTAAEASAGLKTAVLRMEVELGISPSGMKQNGWLIEGSKEAAPVVVAARKTSSGDWLKAVNVEGA